MPRRPYSVRILAPEVFAGALEGVLLNCPVLEYEDVRDNDTLPRWLLKRIAEDVGCDWQTLRGLVDARRSRMHHSTWLGIENLVYCYIWLAEDYLEEIARARKAREERDSRRQRDGIGASFAVNRKAEAEAVAWERVAENAIASCEHLLASARLDLEMPTPEALSAGGAHTSRVAGRRARSARRRPMHK